MRHCAIIILVLGLAAVCIMVLIALMCYCQHTNTNMFVCSLDAEKCFDSIWHDGLFYKLHHVLPDVECVRVYDLHPNLVRLFDLLFYIYIYMYIYIYLFPSILKSILQHI